KHLSGKMNRVMGREIPDTVFRHLEPIEFTNYDGNPVTFLGTDTTITVAHLFYSKDQGLSKQLIGDLNGVANRFIANPQIKFFSISVDSTDTKEDLNTFIENYKEAMSPNWFVVHQGNLDLFNYTQERLLIEALPVADNPNKFIISNRIILIDSQRRIRGFYDIGLRSEIDRLEDEIKVQVVEEYRNNPQKIEKK